MAQTHPTSERIHALNHGLSEAKNLMEFLAVDMAYLLHHILPSSKEIQVDPTKGVLRRMEHIAQSLYQKSGMTDFSYLKSHTSDFARGWACYMLRYHGSMEKMSVEELSTLILPLADDQNSGVREWAWMALRPFVQDNPQSWIDVMMDWTTSPSERIRRFASEITRPRGVWCGHIRSLRVDPTAGLPLLTSLHQDPSRYVQLSVGNWLNDAGKDHPDWVKNLCATWQISSRSLHTEKICKRALRRFKKPSAY